MDGVGYETIDRTPVPLSSFYSFTTFDSCLLFLLYFHPCSFLSPFFSLKISPFPPPPLHPAASSGFLLHFSSFFLLLPSTLPPTFGTCQPTLSDHMLVYWHISDPYRFDQEPIRLSDRNLKPRAN